MESLNNNEIGLEIDLTNMHRALKSAQAAIDVEIRLTKKGDQPYLSFTITTQVPLISHAAAIRRNLNAVAVAGWLGRGHNW